MKFIAKTRYICFIASLFFGSTALKSTESIKDLAGDVVDKVKDVYNGAGGMLKGLGQGFGLVTPDYYYNYRVFNDSHAPIFVAEQRLTGFLGATFKGNIVQGGLLAPTAHQEFLKRQLYLAIYICAGEDTSEYYKTPRDYMSKWGMIIGKHALISPASEIVGQIAKAFGYNKIDDINQWLGGTLGSLLGSVVGSIVTVFAKGVPFTYKDELDKHSILKKIIYPWQPNDNNVYYYRAYTDVADQKPKIKGEFLSLKGTSSEFSGQFYNSANQDIILTFSKDGIDYTVTLESGSFNMLESSTQTNSIRPPNGQIRWFQFYTAKPVSDRNAFSARPIAAEGIAYMINTSKDEANPKYVVGNPLQYSYKIYNAIIPASGLDVALQGLSIGNFDQPVSGKVRDINPAECHLWCVSAEQAQYLEQNITYSTEPFDVPEQVWVTYKTSDYTYQQKVIIGSILDFTILRPQIKEQLGILFVVSLQTNDEAKAKKFLDRLNAGQIGKEALFSEAIIDKNNILTHMTPNLHGVIDDTKGTGNSGIKGIILLADQFAPQGLGAGPYYYIVQPSELRVDQFASVIWFDRQFYLPGTNYLRDDVMKELAEKLPQWIVQYRIDKEGARTALKNYVLEKGSKEQGMFQNPSAAPKDRIFTKQGEELLQTLISGPISLENYPLLRKGGKNYYVINFGKQPENWPEKSA
jgi:hypothetical protein